MSVAYIDGGAVLGGYVAILAGVGLRDLARRGYFDTVPPQARADLLAAIDDLERAGRAWQNRALHDGNPETARPETGPSSPLSAEQAAALLDLTPRRVRQLADQLGGRRIRGRWEFDRDNVTAEAARRREA
jgi:hypothetical protein